jgi:hypothetical protein
MKTWLSGDVSKRLALGGDAETAHELELEIEQVRARLAANEAERKELEAALRDLVSRCSAAAADYSSPTIADAPRVMAASSAAEKIALFRRLFAGRADVFPVRWENRKTAKSGYAPACANEWVKGSGPYCATRTQCAGSRPSPRVVALAVCTKENFAVS